MTTQHDELITLINDNATPDGDRWVLNPEVITTAILAAGWEKPTGDSFQLQAKLTSGETVTVKVSGYSNMRQGCAALVKVADVNTLSQIIAGSEDDEDWS